jgi:hypothetical protein
MKKEWQQKSQALSRADMKKIKGGNDYGIIVYCRIESRCSYYGAQSVCVGSNEPPGEDHFPLCGCIEPGCQPGGPCSVLIDGQCSGIQ